MATDERDSKAAHRRLSKKTRQPPPVAYNNKHHTGGQLKRAPSAASYFDRSGAGSYNSFSSGGLGVVDSSSPGHSPASAYATSSLRRSPSLLTPLTETRTVNASGAYGFHDAPSASRLPSGPELVGDSFTHIVAGAHAAPPTNTNKQLRPPGPVHTQTSDGTQPSRFKKSPRLRQSTSFQQLARKMETPPAGTKSPRNRYSDEADGPKGRRLDSKKKGTFSTFMSSMLGSPRRPTISTPTNPMHVTHVSIDNETGEYTVRPPPPRPLHLLADPSVDPLPADPLHLYTLCYAMLTDHPGPPQGMAAHAPAEWHHRAGAEAAPPGCHGRCQFLQEQRREERRR